MKLSIHLIEHAQGLHAENDKMMMNKVSRKTWINAEIFMGWKIHHNYTSSFQILYRCNEVPIKIPGNFVDLGKLILKFIWKGTGHSIANTIWQRKIKREELLFLILSYYKSIVIREITLSYIVLLHNTAIKRV